MNVIKIINDTDDVKQVLRQSMEPHRYKRGDNVVDVCASAGFDATAFYQFIGNRSDMKVTNLVELVKRFGYKLAVVKEDDNNA